MAKLVSRLVPGWRVLELKRIEGEKSYRWAIAGSSFNTLQ